MDKSPLSPSRIKTLESCSWLYWAKYKLKLPEKTNEGALLGSICHTVFECLGNPRHKKHYNKIVKKRNVYASPSVKMLIAKLMIKYNLATKENSIKLNNMILAGLMFDFFGSGKNKPSKSFTELKFDINVDNGDKQYRILGFIDKLFLYKKESMAIIRDFKSSKKMFEGKEIDDNLQNQIYVLAIKHLYPDFLKLRMEFLFLQFMSEDKPKEGVIAMDKITKDEMEGFEYYLTEIQKVIDNFSEKDSQKSMAYYKDFPKDKSFSGRLLCGFDQQEGQLKKDGTKRWGCPYKWAFEYYAVKDKDGKIIKTYHLDDAHLIDYNEEKGEQLFIEKYKGCPAWNKER